MPARAGCEFRLAVIYVAVVTMGCGDACPFYLGKRYLDWELEDPAGKDSGTVRRIRDDIDSRVRALLAELLRATQEAIASRLIEHPTEG